MFESEDLVGANALLQGSESAVQIAGPAVGGALMAAVLYAVSGLILVPGRWRGRRDLPSPSARSGAAPGPQSPNTVELSS